MYKELKLNRLHTLRVATKLAISLLIVLAFFVASSQPPRSAALSAGIAPLDTPLTTHDAPASAAATRTPTLRKLSSPSGAPTQTPQSAQSALRLPRAPVLDANTVALFHFDSQVGNLVPDATGNYTGTLVGTAMITNTALFGAGALYTNGRDGPGPGYLQVGNLGDLSAGTLEAYIDFSQACRAVSDSFSIISANNGSGRVQAALYVSAMLNFVIRTPQGNLFWVTSDINPCKYLYGPVGLPWPYDVWRWHHVAGTWGPRGMEIWVDGVLHGVGNGYFGLSDSDYCNPQKYVGGGMGFGPNPYYPTSCPGPFFSQTPVAGAYTGGLAASAYTNFLIGCDGTASCFKGRIDDVRISSIQRIFDISVDPPSTPTPTQTPDVISGEYTVDSLTTSLLHLNSSFPYGTVLVTPEEVNANDWRLFGNATIEPGGRFGNGLCVDGAGSYVALGNPAHAARGTVEAWVKLNHVTGSFGIVSGDFPYGSTWDNFFLGMDNAKGNTLRFGIADSNLQWHWADSGVDPSTLIGLWHHVAATWGARGLEIWTDGVLRGTNSYSAPRLYDSTNGDPFLVGCDAWRGCMQGMIDEVRFSSAQRTFAPVAPVSSSSRRGFAPVAPGSRAQAPFEVFIPFVQVNPASQVNSCP